MKKNVQQIFSMIINNQIYQNKVINSNKAKMNAIVQWNQRHEIIIKYLLDLINSVQISCLFSQQADETKIRKDEQKIRETEEQLSELAHTAFSDILTENSKNILDSRYHILIDRWKGMNKDQLNAIRQQQLIQINERQVHTLPDAFS